MSKEIKIRVWDTVAKKMEVYNTFLDVDSYKHLLWSGETDREGAEIYDGDLLQLGVDPPVYEVRFHAAAFLVYKGERQIGLLGELDMCFLRRVGSIYDGTHI